MTAVPARQSIVKIENEQMAAPSATAPTTVRGTPGNPMTADEVSAKALDLMAPILGTGPPATELIAAIDKFDGFGPVSGLRRLLGVGLDFGHASRGWPLGDDCGTGAPILVVKTGLGVGS